VALASHDSDWPAVHVAGQIGKSISGSPSPSLPSQSRPSLLNRIPLTLPFHPTASTWLSPATVLIGWSAATLVEQASQFPFSPLVPPFLPNFGAPAPPFRSEASTWPSPATIPIGLLFTLPAKQVNQYLVSSPSLPSQSRPSLPNRTPPTLPFHSKASTWLAPASVLIG
jgi:hypothetical protein